MTAAGASEVLKKADGARLIALTALKEGGGYAIHYLFSAGANVEDFKIKVPKSKPEVESISKAYPPAAVYELEIHELFGIKFKGNPLIGKTRFLPESLKGRCVMK